MSQLIVITNTLGDMATNCYTVYNKDTREALVVDPAANAHFLYTMLMNQQLNCVGILLTHGHFDHIGAVQELQEKLGHKVPVYAAEAEVDVLGDARKNLSEMFGGRLISIKADILLQDGQELELLDSKIKCLLVPGHTRGGMCYYFPESDFVFSGDTLFNKSVGRSDFPSGDEAALLANIREKLLTLPEETVVYCGHGERTSVGSEKHGNPFFAW